MGPDALNSARSISTDLRHAEGPCTPRFKGLPARRQPRVTTVAESSPRVSRASEPSPELRPGAEARVARLRGACRPASTHTAGPLGRCPVLLPSYLGRASPSPAPPSSWSPERSRPAAGGGARRRRGRRRRWRRGNTRRRGASTAASASAASHRGYPARRPRLRPRREEKLRRGAAALLAG